jgi:N6-adenosine-specific RNA methylase IME4
MTIDVDGSLVRYYAARRAVAEAKAVDEVKEIRNAAIAMAAYARQAKDRGMEADAAEIRMRATRRLGEMLDQQKKTVGLAKGGQPYQETLASQGIDKNLAHEARKLGRMTEEDFELEIEETREYVAYGKREILEKAQSLRDKKTQQRREERLEWIAAQADAGPFPQGRFPIIYADPPWRYEFSATHTRAIERNYETMSLDEIRGLQRDGRKVTDLACDDALLFLWVPPPILEQGFQVFAAWGFSYRSGMVWDKIQIGAGHWVRQQHEHLLIGRRGEFPTPAPEDRPRSILRVQRREHSRKPDEAYALIERMYPDLPKIELFARGEARPGWTVWGNEALGPGASQPPPDPDDGLDIPGFLLRPLPQEPAPPEGRR